MTLVSNRLLIASEFTASILNSFERQPGGDRSLKGLQLVASASACQDHARVACVALSYTCTTRMSTKVKDL